MAPLKSLRFDNEPAHACFHDLASPQTGIEAAEEDEKQIIVRSCVRGALLVPPPVMPRLVGGLETPFGEWTYEDRYRNTVDFKNYALVQDSRRAVSDRDCETKDLSEAVERKQELLDSPSVARNDSLELDCTRFVNWKLARREYTSGSAEKARHVLKDFSSRFGVSATLQT